MKPVFFKALCVIGLAGVVAAPTAMAADALRVVRDQQTGALRAPTAAEQKELNAAETNKPASAPLVARQAANGTRTVTLPAEYLIEVHAERQADGSIKTSHADPALAHVNPNAAVEK